jgi:hypothetical protein
MYAIGLVPCSLPKLFLLFLMIAENGPNIVFLASLPNILFYFVFHNFCLLIHTAQTERECVQQRENLIDSRNQPCRPLSHFLAILAGVDAAFPPYLWDLHLSQAKLTLNLLRQSTLNPWISAWEFFQEPFDFNKTPLGPVGCRVLIHAKPATRRTWDFVLRMASTLVPL